MASPPASAAVELELLVELAGFGRVKDPKQPGLQPSELIDWPHLLDEAARLGVSPQLDQLIGLEAEAMPSVVCERLERRRLHQAARSTLLEEHLTAILTRLDEQQVRVLVLKGPTLERLLRETSGTRAYDDLDLLVPPEDLARAMTALFDLDYRSTIEQGLLQRQSFLRSEKAVPLRHRDAEVTVELHWRLAPRYLGLELDPAELWLRRQLVGDVPTLPLEELVLFLCVHGAAHRWRDLRWIRDLAGLVAIRGCEIDWSQVLELARSSGSGRLLLVGMDLAGRLGVDLPDELRLAAEADPGSVRLAEQAWQGVLSGAPQASLRRNLVFLLRVRDRPADRLRSLMSLAFAPSLADWQASPSGLVAVLRPLRLLKAWLPLGR